MLAIVDRRKELIKYKVRLFSSRYSVVLNAFLVRGSKVRWSAVSLPNRSVFAVPPAELESVLLQHPEVADTAVIGVESHEEATEYPRCVAAFGPFATCFNYVEPTSSQHNLSHRKMQNRLHWGYRAGWRRGSLHTRGYAGEL